MTDFLVAQNIISSKSVDVFAYLMWFLNYKIKKPLQLPSCMGMKMTAVFVEMITLS